MHPLSRPRGSKPLPEAHVNDLKSGLSRELPATPEHVGHKIQTIAELFAKAERRGPTPTISNDLERPGSRA